MHKDSSIYVAGHTGLVGSALVRHLQREGFTNIISRRSAELDLTDQSAVDFFFAYNKPEYVFCAAAFVGGIMANKEMPAQFIKENLEIQTNIIHNSHVYGVKKLLFLGSSCIYPRECLQPIKEEYLLTGALEPTNVSYAVAKIAGITMCQSYAKQYGSHFISLMPTNLYGKNDNYDLQNSHVLPAMIRKFHEAKERKDQTITLWGTGAALREFLHVDDLASACVFLMENYNSPEIVNVGSGEEVSIKQLSELVKEVVGFEGEIQWDSTKPDGTPRKLLDCSKLFSLNWKPSISLKTGIRDTYEEYKNTL